MPPGIRATVAFDADVCPVARVSRRGGATVDSVASTVGPGTTVEFTVRGDHDPATVCDGEAEFLFSHASGERYRLRRDDPECPCARLGRLGCPVANYVARDGVLTLVFHAADYEELRTVLDDLGERFPGLDLRRLIRSPSGEPREATDEVVVDRTVFTDRQLEVLETAHEMGYFERPRRANATDVAAELEIDQSTFSEHLAAAESKLLRAILRRAE